MTGTLKSCAAELIGTFAFAFAGPASVCMEAVSGGRVGVPGIALAHGLTIAAMMYAYGRVSGGHFNPAVTAALMVNRRLGAVSGVFYIASQLLGAALAGLLLKAVLHNFPQITSAAPYLGACDLSRVGFKAGTLLEAVATFFLVGTIYSTTIDSRGDRGTAPIAVGLAYAFAVLAIGPLTGAALNPARAFGPAVASGHWSNWFVYWIGPLAGACAAALLHESLFLQAPAAPEGSAA